MRDRPVAYVKSSNIRSRTSPGFSSAALLQRVGKRSQMRGKKTECDVSVKRKGKGRGREKQRKGWSRNSAEVEYWMVCIMIWRMCMELHGRHVPSLTDSGRGGYHGV